MESIEQLLTSPYQMTVFAFCALAIGMSKTGIQGVVMLCIPFMAQVFGAKESTGVILPMLCFADIIAVAYYRRNANWSYVIKLVPPAILGFFAAIAVDRFVEPQNFKYLMGACILGGLLVMIISRKYESSMKAIYNSRLYSHTFGLLGGFTTMIGNAAGPVMAIYLLSVRLPKLQFVGTTAWFFMVVNYLKIPLQVFAWNNISINSLLIDCVGIPFIFVGAFLGIYFVKKIPEKGFRTFIEIATAMSAVMLFF